MARFKSAINVPKLSDIFSITLTSRRSYPQSNENFEFGIAAISSYFLTYRGKNSYKGTGIYVISLLEGNLSSVPSFTSYHDLVPLESGGVIARSGFDFQDHVSAGYCLDMLACEELLAVWCETLDDITLVWRKDSQEKFEFVQVKNNKFSHFWSVAELCKPGKGKSGEATISGSGSILEKSLAHEQGAEPCSFRPYIPQVAQMADNKAGHG
jgi:Cap4 dsDNA endonuclease